MTTSATGPQGYYLPTEAEIVSTVKRLAELARTIAELATEHARQWNEVATQCNSILKPEGTDARKA